jgi:hypothetical protein
MNIVAIGLFEFFGVIMLAVLAIALIAWSRGLVLIIPAVIIAAVLLNANHSSEPAPVQPAPVARPDTQSALTMQPEQSVQRAPVQPATPASELGSALPAVGIVALIVWLGHTIGQSRARNWKPREDSESARIHRKTTRFP